MAGGLNKNITVRLMADATSFNTTIKAAGANAEKVSKEMEASGRKSSLISTGLAAAGVAASALGATAISMAADFDASMSTVQANTHASAAEMDLLRQAAMQAGADTIYSSTEAADGINELGKAGMSTTDILNGGLTGALDLAASEGMDVGEAAELMSTALAQFNLSGDRATDVADALASGAGNASGSAHDLGMALSQVGTVAHSYGVSMEETVGTLSAFAKAGIIGSDAGTSLKSMLQMLGNPTENAKEKMQELGLSVYDAQGNFIGLSALAGQLQSSMGGLTQEQRNAAMATIFGSDAVRAANILYEQGADGIAKWTDTVSESGYAADMAGKRTDNLKGDLENLSGSIENLMIGLGEGGQGPLRDIVQTVDTLVDAFSTLPAPLQQGAVALTALVGVSAALHSSLGPLSESSSQAARSFSLMMDPVQRLTGAAPQLSAGFAQLKSAFTNSGVGIESMSGSLTRGQVAVGGFKSIAGGLVTLMGGPWGVAFTAAGTAIMSWARNAQKAKQAADNISASLESGGDGIDAFVKAIQDFDIGAGNGLPNWFDRLRLRVDNVPDLLSQCGLSIKDLALAAQGNTDALDKYNDAITRVGQQSGDGAARSAELASILDRAQKAWDSGSKSSKEYSDAVDALSGSSDKAAGSSGDLSNALGEVGDSAEDANDKLSDLVDGVLGLADASIGVDQAQLQLTQTISQSTDTIAKNGQTLDQNTEAGRANQQALLDIADQCVQTADAIMEKGKADGDMTTAAMQASDAINQGRNALIQQAVQAGMSQDAAEKYADSLGLIPSNIWTQIDNNAPLSRDAVQAYLNTLNLTPQEKDTFMNAIDNGATFTIQDIQRYIAMTPSEKDTYMRVIAQTGDAQAAIMAVANARYTATIFVRSQMTDLNGAASGTGRPGTFANGGLIEGYANGGMLHAKPYMRLAYGDGYDGLLTGWGGKRSDNILIAASPGEFMQQASAVDYYGVETMRALNNRQIPKDLLDGKGYVSWAVVQPRVSESQTAVVVDTQSVVDAIQEAVASMPRIIRDNTPVMGRRDFAREARRAVRNGI